MGKSIKDIVNYYVRKFGTNDPFRIAKHLNILVQHGNLVEYSGCYTFLKNHRYIFLNQNLDENETMLVMAHELGHAILHSRTNCYFIRNKTFLLCSRIEREANLFLVNLFISDDDLKERRECTVSQLSCEFGLDENLIELRIKGK